MIKYVNQKKTVITTEDNFNKGSVVIQALINSLVALKIIFEEELENC